jgi:hypothetical protein
MRKLAFVFLGCALCASVASAQFVAPGATIPVVANTPGVGDTYWRSDVSILNINPWDITVVMYLLPEIRNGEPTFEPIVTEPIAIPAMGQRTMPNVVQTEFGLVNRKGALSILSLDGSPITASSRVYTFGAEGGSYGQDVHSVLTARTAWAPGVRQDSLFRTNLGIFMPLDPVPGAATLFNVTIYDADGTVAGSGTVSFPGSGVIQKNVTAFGVGTLVDGYAEITCADPSVAWYAYVSQVDQMTGDAVYRAARGRQQDIP